MNQEILIDGTLYTFNGKQVTDQNGRKIGMVLNSEENPIGLDQRYLLDPRGRFIHSWKKDAVMSDWAIVALAAAVANTVEVVDID